MNIFAPTISKNIILHCLTSLTSSILTTHNIYNFIIDHKNNNYQIYKNKLIATDLANKLIVVSSLIRNIIHKYHTVNDNSSFVTDNDIDQIISEYKKNDLFETIELDDSNCEISAYNFVLYTENNLFKSNIPEPIKLALKSTLEIIDKINNILEQIQKRIVGHSNSYTYYFVKINIENNINEFILLNNIFESRLNLLFNILKIIK